MSSSIADEIALRGYAIRRKRRDDDDEARQWATRRLFYMTEYTAEPSAARMRKVRRLGKQEQVVRACQDDERQFSWVGALDFKYDATVEDVFHADTAHTYEVVVAPDCSILFYTPLEFCVYWPRDATRPPAFLKGAGRLE